MSGNVWEWTSTIYDLKNYPYPYWFGDGREELTRSDVSRVVRGGSWQSLPEMTRATMRQGEDPITGDESVGFRLVYDPSMA
jgi:formylglycine-generating enzyme required for sulfatase activity